MWRGGKQVQLSPTEFKLLRYFMSNANRVLSKMQILDHVWDYDFRGDTGIVESYVSVLRRKIDTKEPRRLHHTCAASDTCCGSPRRNRAAAMTEADIQADRIEPGPPDPPWRPRDHKRLEYSGGFPTELRCARS